MDFIVCHSKKAMPKVNVSVCEKCKHRRSCEDYSRYRQPLLFPHLASVGDAQRTKKKRASMKPSEPMKKQEQLAMKGMLKSN